MSELDKEIIISTARSWIGTKFHHQGRLKQNHTHKRDIHLYPYLKHSQHANKNDGGVDCIGLIIGIAKELNLKNIKGTPLSILDRNDYTLNIQNNDLYENMYKNLYIGNKMELRPADIICFKIQNYVKHVAILSYQNNIIHVSKETNQVIEHQLSDYWLEKIFATFKFTEVVSKEHKQ